jgi:acetoin utilization protein AcuB
MNVRRHMSAPPITISEDTDFKSALGLMQKHRIRRLPVVDEGGVLTGIVAERDLLVAADRYLSSPVDVARIMTRQVVTVGETTPVVDAAELMMERKIGGLPVVDPSRKLLGIITETDLLKALVAMLRREEQSTQATKPRRPRARMLRYLIPLK